MKKVITTQEAAYQLGVHQTTIQRWIKAGRLDTQKGIGQTSPYHVHVGSLDRLKEQLQKQSHS
jgi:excisionase family DNA binding protein